MARRHARYWGQSSSDVDEPRRPSPAKAARWSVDSGDEDQQRSRSSKGTASASKAAKWLRAESESSTDDIWQRRGNHHGVAPKATAKPKTGAKTRPWAQCSSSSDDNCPGSKFQVSSSSSSDGNCPGSSSGVPVRGKRDGRPVVDLDVGALQLKSEASAVRDNLTSYEEWGFNAKRLHMVTSREICKCKRKCYMQLQSQELASLCTWYHGHLTYAERQYVIHTLYHQATNDDSGVEVLDQHEDHDRVRSYVQWRLQGSPISLKHPAFLLLLGNDVLF